MYDKECLSVFLRDQQKLFPEKVAYTEEEAADFLDEVMAVVCDSKEDVIAYLDDTMDITGLKEEEIFLADEVFALPSGRYLIVEG